MADFNTALKIKREDGWNVLISHILMVFVDRAYFLGKFRRIIQRDFHDYIVSDNWGDSNSYGFFRIELKMLYGFLRGNEYSLNQSKIVLSNLLNESKITEALYEYEGYGRFHSLRPMQVKKELEELDNFVTNRNLDNVLEVGSARNSTTVIWANQKPSNVVSIDLPEDDKRRNTLDKKELLDEQFSSVDFEYLRGSSHSQEIQSALAKKFSRDFDLIFLDGDHSYEGVKKDFDDYKDFLSDDGCIVLHDIQDENCGVSTLWEELSQRYQTDIIVGEDEDNSVGIGIIQAHSLRSDDI